MKRPFLFTSAIVLLSGTACIAQEISLASASEPNRPTFENAKNVDELNTVHAEAYPWISADGLRLYFTQGEEVGTGNIFMASRATVNDLFADPVTVSDAFPEGSFSGWLTPDENTIYFVRKNNLYKAQRASRKAAFDTPEEILLAGIDGFFSGPSLSPGGDELFLYNHNEERKIMRMTRSGENSYILAEELDFPMGYVPGPGQLSKDGLRYFVSLENGDAEKLYVLERSSPGEAFGKAVPAEGFENYEAVSQPTISGEGTLVFTSNTDSWESNDLVISNSDIARSKPIVKKENGSLTVYPNPFNSTATLQFSIPAGEQVKISLYNLSGLEIAVLNDGYMSEGEHIVTLDREGLKQGAYIARLASETKVLSQRVVITD